MKDGTLQRKRSSVLPLFVFLSRQFERPPSRHEERLSVFSIRARPMSEKGRAVASRPPQTRNEEKMKRETTKAQVPADADTTVELYSDEKSISSPQALKSLLDEAARRHKGGCFHYTTASKFLKMMESEKLFLTHSSYMNDKLEAVDLDPRMYIASFSFGVEESIGMWGNYGRPQTDAVRLRFPQQEMRRLCERLDAVVKSKRGIAAFAVRDGDFETIEAGDVKEVSFHDVGYLGRQGRMVEHCRTFYSLPNELKRNEKSHVLSSYLKKRGWAYEHETRLVICMKKELREWNGKPLRNIAIDFKEILERMKMSQGCVTIGPCFGMNPYKRFNDVLPSSCLRLSEYMGMVELPPDAGDEETPQVASTTTFNNCTFISKQGKS